MSGKEKCRLLKELRKKIAEENNIEYNVKPCSFHGDCRGTCPACDKELTDLTQKVNKLGLGVTAAVGISLLSLGLNGCISDDSGSYGNYEQALGGETTLSDNELDRESETADESPAVSDESKEPEATDLTEELDITGLTGVAVFE